MLRQHKFSEIGNCTFHPEEYSTAEQFWNTSWTKSRQHKFTDIGNSIFFHKRSTTSAKFSEGFTPKALFPCNSWEQQCLKNYKNSLDYKMTSSQQHDLSRKRVILSAVGVSSKKSCYFLLPVTTIKVPPKKMFQLQ